MRHSDSIMLGCLDILGVWGHGAVANADRVVDILRPLNESEIRLCVGR